MRTRMRKKLPILRRARRIDTAENDDAESANDTDTDEATADSEKECRRGCR